MSKRPCVAPRAVLHAGVLASIGQCLASTNDVRMLLLALPLDALDEPLTALRSLVSTPRALHPEHWPQVCIEDMDDRYTATVLAALPVFSSKPGAIGDATMAFVAKWGHKVKCIRLTTWQEHYIHVLAPLLRLCTGLDEIIVHAAEADPRFLNAVAVATLCITRMYLAGLSDNAFASKSWLTAMTTWLASGRARELKLVNIVSTDDKILARAIAAAASLTSLELRDTYGLVQGLLEAAMPLPHLTALRLQTQLDTTNLELLLTNAIKLSALRVLELGDCSSTDDQFFLMLLPRLVALEELSLARCRMRSVHPLTLAPAPRRLQTLTLYRCFMDDISCLSLLDWALQSPYLKSISLDSVATVKSKPVHVGRLVRRWITAGIERVTIPSGSMGAESVIAVAMALCDTPVLTFRVVHWQRCDDHGVLCRAVGRAGHVLGRHARGV
ncbi:hypothetical protein SDRG_03967 [Saprolegnia diclina VS20]|uniref:F-box domain-containing protein n=1 Tax=Saprolegnia diclina (strain VS20) TaxID=1156394 RepID=T0QYA2_SAPDV|nr:hypothetical protein SDRG_03967 [Saprolegnia diclina VS20]EQC39015.1 hypothetical protein SDRG_03967 [Saprolegnia diclina VS20]|eukprot:XP_008607839.1 hypothetical protein SDRG_03967 [Saprolegnia diclina VS20]